MKKPLAIILASLALASCRHETNSGVNRFSDTGGLSGGTTDKKKDSFHDFTLTGYQGQLSYITASSETEIAEFNAEHEIAQKVKDTAVTWEYFDSLYKDELSNGERQNVGVLILLNKDLIGLAREDPDNVRYKRALKKYIDILVDTEYFGYCLLYSALEQYGDSAYAKLKASEIIAYSYRETFHEMYLNDPNLKDDFSHGKVEEDLSYLLKIRELQN